MLAVLILVVYVVESSGVSSAVPFIVISWSGRKTVVAVEAPRMYVKVGKRWHWRVEVVVLNRHLPRLICE
jgi:hypothetical protein